MKKLLSVLLTIILVVSIVPIASLTVSAENYFTCKVVGGKATITDVDTTITGDVVIPEKWGGFNVVAIGDNAFYDCDNITGITIPDTVTKIGVNAFAFCDKLESVSLSKNVTVLNDGVFSDCVKLKNVSLNDNITEIGGYAFANCQSLEGITIPNSVTNIGEAAFSFCSGIKSIDIGNSVAGLGKYAFGWCDNLAKVKIGNGVTEISEGAFGYCSKLSNITLGNKITVIGDFAFCNSDIEVIDIPDGVTDIGKSAFEDCESLARITMPKTINNIGDYAFYNCDAISDVWSAGSESDEINIGIYNECLTDANWHYSMCSIKDHVYNGDCLNGCTVCGWVPDKHFYVNACDTKCNFCNKERTVTEHTYKECFVTYEKNEEFYGNWANTVTQTGVYTLTPDSHFNGDYNIHDIAVFDKSGKEVLFYEKLGGWPLVKDLQYTVKFRYDCQDECDGDVLWNAQIVTETIFSDTASEKNGGWYNDSVIYSVGAGLITGYGGTNKFGTADNIQRQDFVVILARLAGVDLANYQSNRSSFADVPKGAYYEKAIMWAADCGITTGYADGSGRFGVGDKVTREQLVTFLYRYVKHINGGAAPAVNPNAEQKANAYADYNGVTDYAKEPIIWALDKGVISGQGGTRIAPAGNALRCEVAKIIYNIFLNDIF